MKLTKREQAILNALRPNEVVTYDEINLAVWGEVLVYRPSKRISVNLSRIRDKMYAADDHRYQFDTVVRVGIILRDRMIDVEKEQLLKTTIFEQHVDEVLRRYPNLSKNGKAWRAFDFFWGIIVGEVTRDAEAFEILTKRRERYAELALAHETSPIFSTAVRRPIEFRATQRLPLSDSGDDTQERSVS